MSEQKVVAIKFVTGEEIIGMLGAESLSGDTVTIEFPLVTQLMQDGIAFMPFMPTAKTESIVLQSRVIMVGPLAVQPQMEVQYLEILGQILADMEKAEGGIELPETKQIIL